MPGDIHIRMSTQELPLTLDQACDELHRMVDAFKARWLRNRIENPDFFPMQLSDGEWFESFMTEATTGQGLIDPQGPADA